MPSIKFLLISPSYTCNPITGSGQRTRLLFNALKALGQVDVLLIGNGKPESFRKFFEGCNQYYFLETRDRGESGGWRHLRPLSPNLVDRIAGAFGSRRTAYQPDGTHTAQLQVIAGNQYHFIVGRYLRQTAQSGFINNPPAPVILDVDDRDDMVYLSRMERSDTGFFARLIFGYIHRQVRDVMDELLPACSHLWLTNQTDYDEIAHPSKSLLPNVPYVFNPQAINNPEQPGSKSILFVGSFGHRVNQEGVENFIRHCWPEIQAQVPDAQLRIVGSQGWESWREKYRHVPGLHIVGYVKSLADEYKQAAFSVVPLFEGGGTKIKVLESLSYQRTCVVTPYAHIGYEGLKHNECLLVANDWQGLIDACLKLLNASELRARLAKTGQQAVRETYSVDSFTAHVHNTIRQLSV